MPIRLSIRNTVLEDDWTTLRRAAPGLIILQAAKVNGRDSLAMAGDQYPGGLRQERCLMTQAGPFTRHRLKFLRSVPQVYRRRYHQILSGGAGDPKPKLAPALDTKEEVIKCSTRWFAERTSGGKPTRIS